MTKTETKTRHRLRPRQTNLKILSNILNLIKRNMNKKFKPKAGNLKKNYLNPKASVQNPKQKMLKNKLSLLSMKSFYLTCHFF